MNNQKFVRTRFAPSPTGFLHLGGARTALFNYLYARSMGGSFILRVEDTDKTRSTKDSFRTILDSLRWLNIDWDEGPEKGGNFGPYIQSKRLDIYKKYTEQLLKEKKAYQCFCTQQQLETKKKQSESIGIPYVYDRICSNMSEKEIEKKINENKPYSIRFKIESKSLIVPDLIQSKVKFDTKLIGDFIIIKSDGFPSYNYAVVIDDHLMKISHVIRGVGHLSNTPRQILLYEAFDFPIPKFAHVSEIVSSDRKKLSKRAGAISILEFKNLGYMPEAFINYMALLGWSPPDGKEYLSDRIMEKNFNIERCSKSAAMFDFFKKSKKEKENLDRLTLQEIEEQLNPKSKLNWLSNKYIKDANIKKIAKLVLDLIQDRTDIPDEVKSVDNEVFLSILDSIRVYLDRLNQAPNYIAEFFVQELKFETEEAKNIFIEGISVVECFRSCLDKENPQDKDDFNHILQKVGELSKQKGKQLFMPIRVATTGKIHGLELPILLSLLKKEKILNRIEQLIKQI